MFFCGKMIRSEYFIIDVYVYDHGLLAGHSGHAYLGSWFELSVVPTAMLEMLRPD